MPPAIAPATPADLADLHALIESAYRGDSAKRGWTHEADLLEGQRTDEAALAAMLTDGNARLHVARAGDRAAIGCVFVTRRDGAGYIGMLCVAPGLQGAGLGDRLLTHAEADCRERLATSTARMTVFTSRAELIAWYGRRGWRDTGAREPFAEDAGIGRSTGAPLVFAILEKPLG